MPLLRNLLILPQNYLFSHKTCLRQLYPYQQLSDSSARTSIHRQSRKSRTAHVVISWITRPYCLNGPFVGPESSPCPPFLVEIVTGVGAGGGVGWVLW